MRRERFAGELRFHALEAGHGEIMDDPLALGRAAQTFKTGFALLL